jgi:hypothetical protein
LGGSGCRQEIDARGQKAACKREKWWVESREHVILAVHIPAGALAGRRARKGPAAFGWGVLSHAALDLIPHKDPFGERAEIAMTAAMLALVAALTRLDGRALAGAIGGALPDLEHLMPWVRQGGRAVFPTHSSARLHGSLPTRVELGGAAQLAIAAALMARLALVHAPRTAEQG